VEEGKSVLLSLTLGAEIRDAKTAPVTTEMLGKAQVPGLGYENPDGSPLKIDRDYCGKPRNAAAPTAGPFENPGTGSQTFKVW